MIYITGDTHGRFQRIMAFCEKMQTTVDDTLIILGDVGVNTDSTNETRRRLKRLSKLPITLFCVHGNHERRPHHYANYELVTAFGARVWADPNYPNVMFAKDGEMYDFAGLKTIVCGGAYSIDKQHRLLYGYPWWPDEQPSQPIKNAVESKLSWHNWNVDVVLTHTCPRKYEPVEVFLPFVDQDKVDKSTEDWLNMIENKLQYKKWYCGHYHTIKKVDRLQFMFEDFDEFGLR